MKLTKVTITGIDERTDLERLQDLQKRFPFAEFGMLISGDWLLNGNRFPDPQILWNLANILCKPYAFLHLSCHFCGTMATGIVKGDFSVMDNLLPPSDLFRIFERCQLNVNADGMFGQLRRVKPFANLQEVIVQMHSSELFREFCKGTLPDGVSYLLDTSGGRGIDTPIQVVDAPGIHVGYAGGIGPDNVEEKLRTLLEYPSDGRFWIDMETRVRDDDDWLDLDKVEQVLATCDALLKDYSENNRKFIHFLFL